MSLNESNENNHRNEARQTKSATLTKSDVNNLLDGGKLKNIKFEDMKADEDNTNTNTNANTSTNTNTNTNNDSTSSNNINSNNNEEDEEVRKIKLKYKRANSTPLFDQRASRVGIKRINHRDKKIGNHRKYHHSNSSRNNPEDFIEDDEKVQNDIIFPNYIPKVSSMEEYKFIRHFLLSTIIIMILVMLLGVKLQMRIGNLSKEIKTIQENSIYDFESLSSISSSSSPFSSNEDPEKIKKIVKDKETYEKLKKISEALGLTIPQLLYTNWDEYELV